MYPILFAVFWTPHDQFFYILDCHARKFRNMDKSFIDHVYYEAHKFSDLFVVPWIQLYL
ncbi:hypothetical protein ACJX0J_010733, partial [Zea mays]